MFFGWSEKSIKESVSRSDKRWRGHERHQKLSNSLALTPIISYHDTVILDYSKGYTDIRKRTCSYIGIWKWNGATYFRLGHFCILNDPRGSLGNRDIKILLSIVKKLMHTSILVSTEIQIESLKVARNLRPEYNMVMLEKPARILLIVLLLCTHSSIT